MTDRNREDEELIQYGGWATQGMIYIRRLMKELDSINPFHSHCGTVAEKAIWRNTIQQAVDIGHFNYDDAVALLNSIGLFEDSNRLRITLTPPLMQTISIKRIQLYSIMHILDMSYELSRTEHLAHYPVRVTYESTPNPVEYSVFIPRAYTPYAFSEDHLKILLLGILNQEDHYAQRPDNPHKGKVMTSFEVIGTY